MNYCKIPHGPPEESEKTKKKGKKKKITGFQDNAVLQTYFVKYQKAWRNNLIGFLLQFKAVPNIR